MAKLKIRRRTPPVGPDCRRGKQELGAAADCRVPADGSGVRADQRAAHPRRRCAAELLVGLGATVDGRGYRHPSDSMPQRSPAIARTPRWSASCVDPCCCLARSWRGMARRVWRQPGGDFPARRTILTHLQALVGTRRRPARRAGHALDAPDGLSGASFYLDEASVTGTETALLAAAGAKGRTEIRHAAMEPHVVELCRFLRAMGASIEGEGTSTIRVEAPGAVSRRRTSPRRRLHRGRQLGRHRGDHRRRHRGAPVRAVLTWRSSPRPLEKMGLECSYADDRWSSSRRR